jgi:hypothetical protein
VNGPAVELDATPGHVMVARAFTASTMRVLGCSDRDIEAVRLVVSEMVTALVRAGAGPIRVALTEDDNGCALVVAGPADLPELSGPVANVIEGTLGSAPQQRGNRWLIPITVGSE